MFLALQCMLLERRRFKKIVRNQNKESMESVKWMEGRVVGLKFPLLHHLVQ